MTRLTTYLQMHRYNIKLRQPTQQLWSGWRENMLFKQGCAAGQGHSNCRLTGKQIIAMGSE